MQDRTRYVLVCFFMSSLLVVGGGGDSVSGQTPPVDGIPPIRESSMQKFLGLWSVNVGGTIRNIRKRESTPVNDAPSKIIPAPALPFVQAAILSRMAILVTTSEWSYVEAGVPKHTFPYSVKSLSSTNMIVSSRAAEKTYETVFAFVDEDSMIIASPGLWDGLDVNVWKRTIGKSQRTHTKQYPASPAQTNNSTEVAIPPP